MLQRTSLCGRRRSRELGDLHPAGAFLRGVHNRGQAWINGTKIIKITGSMTEPDFWSGPHGERQTLHADATLYVDPSTYLPSG